VGTLAWSWLLPCLLAAAAIAAGGAWAARDHALRHRLLDQPGERRSHTVPTPRGGGIGIALAWGLAWLVAPWYLPVGAALAAAVLAGLLLVGGVGFLDDHRPLSAWHRLLAHVLAGVLLAAALAWEGAGTWQVLFALAAVPVLVNVWNFMDGIDGLAATQAALVALGFALLSPDAAGGTLALVLVAACIGFLPMNFPRARIFLGDVGSGALGFALAVHAALLLGAGAGGPGMLAVLVLPLSAFMVDATLTLARRIVAREQWWQPHVQHSYQQLAFSLGDHRPVTLLYGAWTAAAHWGMRSRYWQACWRGRTDLARRCSWSCGCRSPRSWLTPR
jgi:UDP-N-acetylmuramyl pentapeptide phosphotransferase/UDP-N-acetylglucosamine-1-phosphate transferase